MSTNSNRNTKTTQVTMSEERLARYKQAAQNEAALAQREAEQAAQAQAIRAANEQQKAETINRIASAYPLSPENLGPSPLQTNRASNSPYSAILNGLSPMQSNVQPVSRAVNEPLKRLKINRHDPIFEEQAQKKLAEQAAKDRIASRDTSDYMASVRTGMKEQPKEQAQPTQSRNLLAVNVDAERSKRENAEKMQDQIKDLQKVVNAYDATGIYDDRYEAYKFTLDDAQKEYDRLYSGVMKDQDIDQAEKLQRLAEIESVQGNSDYWGKTQYDPSLGSVSTYNPVTNTYETTGDLVYDIVNDRNGARGIDAANAAAMGADLAGLDLSRLKQMSADERRVYNYLYNTNGKEQADEYLQLLSSDLNARQMNEVTTWWRDYAAEHPMAASAASVVMSPMRGLSYLGQAGDMAMINKDEEGYYRNGLDQNAGYNRFSRIPSEIRNEVSQNIESKWGKEGSFLYQTGMSMADFITNAALSGNFLGNAHGSAAAAVSEALSLTIMGTGAAADATIAAKERGLDDDQSFALGTIAGVAEILTEKVSMESLLDLTHMDRNMIGYLLKNTLAEGSEEVGSDFINLFADIIISKDESEWAKAVQEYKDEYTANGMKGKDAENKAFWAAFADQAKQMWQDFKGGALSGLAMASGSAVINRTAQEISNRRFENAIAQLSEMDAQARSLDAQAAADAIEEAQENIQPGTDATMEPDASPANSAPEANAQADVELAQQLAANGTDPAIISAITGLMPDQEGNWTATAETQQTAQPAEQMTTQPAEQTTTQAAEPADIVNGGLTNEVPVSGSGEWNDGTRTGGQSGPVAEGTGRAAENVATRARELGAVRAGRYAAATGEVRSTADLGIKNGIESKTLREVPYTADPELENIHQLTQAMGVDTVFLDHKMQIRNNGRIQNVNGAYDPSTNRIYVCVTDAKHTASALTMHEMYHAMQAANSALTATTWSALEQRFGKEYMDNRLMKTIEAYNGVYGLTDDDLHYYQEEVIADIYGGLNRGTLEVTPELQAAVMEIADQPHWSTPGEARAAAETADQMDSTVSSIDDEDDLGPTSQAAEEAFVRYSLVTDPDELQFLDNQDGVKVYRAMQVIDGELYPPMAAKVKDESGRLKLVEPTRIGEWYRSDERQDLIKGGKFVLNKGNGKTVPAAYNPYFHTSASPLNDQFSSAYKRPNLVVVECEIPASELTSGYKAPYAKDSVGETKWHAGPVASKLKGEKARRVFLSRWVKVNRIMPDAEVADIIANTLQGESVSVPSNVVTPTLLSELRDRGVKIEDIPGQGAPESTRFSMAEPVEETGTLIALHNLNERKARDMLRLGGLPAPSIAIVRADAGHDNFGDISMVFPRETIDPRANRKNRVYGSDAWTPTASNARVEYPINRDVDIAFNNRIDDLSSSVAGGLFRNSNILGSIGLQNDTSDMSIEEIARRLESKEAIRAAYLADSGRNIEPVVEEKQWNRTYGNDSLRRFVDAVGPVRLAQIEANFVQEMPMDQALGDDAEIIRQIMWDYYRQSSEAFVRKQAKARGLNEAETEAALDRYANRGMEKVRDYAIEDFARDAWAYYEDNGNTKDQINKMETLDDLERATHGEDVKGWLEQQLQGLLGEPGVYNGKEIFTPSGNRRSFAALHNPYTAEGIVKAMYGSTEGARGQNTFGTGARSLMSVATPEYRSVDEIHADEGRLRELDVNDYNSRVDALDDRITEFIRSVRRNNKAYSDNSFEEDNNIGTVLMDNAGQRTAERIRRGFAAEGYTLTPEQAEEARSIYAQAAAIPSDYFEAKPERVVSFDEVLGVVAPDNAPEDLLEQMRAAGMDVLTYQHGNNQDRLEKVNSIPDVRFSVDETEKFESDEAYEEQVEEVAPQVQYSLAYEENDQHISDLEKNYSKESAADLEDLKQTTRNVTQMWRDIASTVNSSIVNEWNSRQGSDRVFTVFKAQMGYRYNAELSSMCKKGIPLFEAIDALVQKDTIKRLNSKTLGLDEKKILYELLQERGFEIPCAICFVEQSRQREGVLINNFLNGDDEGKLGWNNVLDDLERRMADAGVIFSFDNMSRDIATDHYNWRDTALPMTDAQQAAFEQALMDACNEELEKFNETAKRPRKMLTSLSPSAIKASLGGSISSNLRIFKVLATEPQSRLRIDPSLLYSSYTTRNLAKSGNHNQLYTLFNSQGGVSGAKSKQRAEVYWGDVLKKKWSPSKVRDETGLRNQSNSDLQMITFLDQAQLYTDLTAKGYYLQAYTKTLTEAKLFGLSNAKINCSLIPAVRIYRNADGSVDVARTMETAGLDETGEPIYDDVEGINHNEYIMLRSIPEYSQSLGGTCIGYSDRQIEKLLDTDYVTQIIGYHDKTNDPKKRYRGATYAKNYNGENEAVDRNGKTVHLSFSEFLRKAEQRFQKTGEDFEGTTTYDGREWTANDIPKLAAQMYKDTCDQKGYSYAYPQFAEYENYYKLLVDFPVYDNQGNYAPHKKVNFQLPAQVPMREADGSISWMDTAEFVTENLRSETMVTERIAEEMAETGPDSMTEEFVRRANAEGQMRLSVADETEEELPDTQTEEQQTRAQAEAMTQAQLEQRLRTDREQTEKYNLLRTEGMITPELERRAEIHDQATRIREQVLAEKRKGTGDSIDTQVDLTIRVGRKESARNLLRNLEQRKSALSMLPKAQQDAQMMADLNAGIERLKNHLREQNKSARQEIRKQREETARNVQANESRTTLRDELLRSFSVEQGRRGQIGQLIDDFATRIQEQGRLSRDDRNRLFNELLDSGAVRVIEDDYAAEIRNRLRGTRVYVPQEVRDEWKGDFNEFRRRAWGAGLYLTSNPEDGSWDIHNAELAELYPGAFAEDETDAKVALENMLSAAENGKPVNMSLKDWLKLESGGSEEGTASALRTMMEEMDAALNRFAGAQKIEIDMKARSIMEEAREMLAMQERAERIRENRELSELQKETMSSMRQLSRLRKKTSNANRQQIDAVIGNIDLLARHISPEGLENLQALQREYQVRKEEMGDNFIPNEYVEERLSRLSQRHIDEMDADELRELGRVVSGMITSIKNAQQLIGEENARMIADVATEWQDEVSNSKGMNTNLLNRWLKADQARPSTFLQMISGWRDGAGQLLSRQLESGELKQLRFMQRASEMFDPFTKENKDWLKKASGKNAEWITIDGIDGVDAESNSHVSSISITPMMRVALFMHANNYDNMRHIAEGGIRIPDQKLYQQGKVDDAYNRGKRILLQPTDVYKILGGSPKTGDLGSNMTEQEKAFAKIMKRYMDGLSKEAINETSMELDGFERAMEANYYPIQTDRRYLKTPPDAVKHDISVENTGSIANERQHAANPIELRDATDTLAWHMEQTARYHGMAVPIRNLNAVYKYNFMRQPGDGARYATSVEDTIVNKWGGDATKYIEQLMADLQGGQSAEQSTFGQISAKLRGKLAGATLTLNPSVALSQAASYPAALQQLGVKAMVRGLNLANRVDENLIAAYTPLLWYRAQGNITDELNKDNLKLPRVLDWISEMDRATVKRLWAASEAWVQDNTDLQKPESPAMDGSDPYYQRVAEKFNRVVFDTQPNYTTMQRTQLQRQGNELTKILAMYKTVPLQYYNMMLEAQSRLQETSARAKAEGATEADKKAYEEARQFATRTHTGLLISNAVYVLMKTVLMNALVRKRDDLKDDEGNTTLASAAEGIGWALAEVYAGSIIGSDVLMQAAKHLAKGDRFYGLELSSVSTINDLVEQGIDIGDVLKKVLTGTADLDDGLDAIHDAAAMATRLLGIPAENVEKYMVSAMKWIAPEWANKYENLFDQIEKRDLKAGSSQKDLEAQISVLMENRTDDLQEETIQELARLWAAGYGNVIPTAIQNTATVNGEDITLTAKQKKAYRDAWSDPVSNSLQDLMDTDLYQEADDEQRQKMIASLYDYARGKAKEATLDVEPDAWIKAADESDMNLADYIAERAWLNSMAGNDDQSATEVKMEQLMAADMDDTLRAQTYKTVLASPSEKAALEAVGGTEADQVEAVNTLYQIRTATATDEQTAAEQKRNAIKESDLTKEQQAELYYNLLADKDGKAWIDNVTAAGDDKADVVQALMNYQNASGTVEKIQTILDSDLSEEGKLELYHKITKERDDRIETFRKAGLDLDDYLTITQKYSEINAGDESAGEKSTAFAKWLDDQKYTRNQIDTVKDEMGYYSMVRANSDKYDALTGAGLSSQNAQMIYESVNALEPEDGASQVSEVQKLEAIGNSNLSEKQQLEAAKVYASDSSDRKLDVLDGYSVSVSQWAEFRNLYAEYQEQYKGQKGANQSAAKDAAMDVIGANISTQAGREAAAALWQTADTGWKAKNNPFDVSTGEQIYNAMH